LALVYELMLKAAKISAICNLSKGCRGLVVKASDWPSFDRQFKPYPRAIMAAPLRCGLDADPNFDGIIHQ
jgi:hypothetical protein